MASGSLRNYEGDVEKSLVFDFNPQEALGNSISCLLPQLVDTYRQLTGRMFNLILNVVAFPRANRPREAACGENTAAWKYASNKHCGENSTYTPVNFNIKPGK